MKYVLFCALFLSLPFLFKRDFKVPPIHADIPFNPAWEAPPPSEEILTFLQQPFLYLAHGNQSTVFESQDGRYVLKLFRYKGSRFPLLQQLKNSFAKKPKTPLLLKLHKTFTAAHLAHTHAQPFTCVLYTHLNLTQNQLPRLVLKARRTFSLPLDRYRFVLQRKVNPFKATLLSAKHDPARMQRLIESFVSLLIRRSALGIRNADPNLGPNFGFLDDQAVELDFGNYRPPPYDPHLRRIEIDRFLHRFEEWLSRNAPESVAFLNALRYDGQLYEDSQAPD